MQVHLLPVLKDNYIFLLHDAASKTAIVVDPAEADPVISKLGELDATLIAILNTHHHQDHIGGNQELVKMFPKLTIYGGEQDFGRIPGQQVLLNDGDCLDFDGKFGHNPGTVLFIPGHTRAHIAYYFPDSDNLFCGDTMFAGGCGRLFEGTPAQMQNSLQKLARLPGSTQVWCAHEYTLANLRFALTVDAQNIALQNRFQAATQARQKNLPTIPTNIELENQTNPFLRCHQPEIQAKMGFTDALEVFTKLRSLKDTFA